MGITQFVAIVTSTFLFVFVLELVRRRQLREEYSWLWLFMSTGYFLMALYPAIPSLIARLIGSTRTSAAFEFLGIFFLVLICIQFSVRLSRLTNRNKYLAQQNAILNSELQELSSGLEKEKLFSKAKLNRVITANVQPISNHSTNGTHAEKSLVT